MAEVPTRESALELLRSKLHTEQLVVHSLASEAIMRALARRLGEDEDLWGICGLLHDLDLDQVGDDMSVHGTVTATWLRELSFPEEGVDAILRHNEALGYERETVLDHALAAAEQITGLIRATALIYPSKRLADVKPKSISKRMKDKRFAAKVSREAIRECELIGIPLAEFIQISLDAMKDIAKELGL